ncbi:MAG: hypothetical protein M3033_10580 [Acidobacteriota bacterium]|nr:hypothetical protein [Acidobacteriota bacterium]
MRFKFFILFAFLLLGGVSSLRAQTTAEKPAEKEKQESGKQKAADATKNFTAEQIAESTVVIYGGLGGRATLNQIRKTTLERGKISVVNAEGKTEQANYERWIMRADTLDKERIRFEQEFPSAKYALIYANDKIFGLYNDAVFVPREDASKAFENQIWHGLEALLRFKENGSTLQLAGRDKILGVDFYMLDVTDKQKRKTRFYISSKTFRVMMVEYAEGETKYRRKFYDYNYAQGTLVPFRSVLWANDKQIEETEVQTITFGQKVEENIFQGS